MEKEHKKLTLITNNCGVNYQLKLRTFFWSLIKTLNNIFLAFKGSPSLGSSNVQIYASFSDMLSNVCQTLSPGVDNENYMQGDYIYFCLSIFVNEKG